MQDPAFSFSSPQPRQTLDEYLARFTSAELIDDIASAEGIDRTVVAEMLPRYAAEARFGWHKVAPHLPKAGRILEIGSGLGMLSGYLQLQGYNVTPLEPCATGFGLFSKILSVLMEKELSPAPMNIGAEGLSPEKHGRFDCIFSVNVLEHIPDLEEAMKGMVSVLAHDGRMWHHCANYTVPYEPHFSVPLIPFFPHATRMLLPGKITESDLWKSINFVTVSRMRRIARANGCKITFRPGLMAESLARLDTDPAFALRHKGWVTSLYGALRKTGLLKLVGFLPPSLNTPMEMEIRRKA